MKRMAKSIKTEWLGRLRGGRYTQGQGFLTVSLWRGSWSHCPLGVLCAIASEAGVVTSEVQPRGEFVTYVSTTDETDRSALALPKAVALWADLVSVDPVLPVGPYEFAVSALNDQHKWDFGRIAALIERAL